MTLSSSDLIAIGSLIVASFAFYKSLQVSKEIFLNTLRENIKKVKHEILGLEIRDYTHLEKIRIIEKLHDLTFYQGYKIEKNKYLDEIQKKQLSEMQEQIEDSVACILIDCDTETNQQQILEKINNFIEIL